MLDFCIRGQTSLTTPVSTPTVVLISCRGGPLLSGMFGTFPVAQTFHDAVGAAHAQQMRNLHAHRQALITVGEKARHAATGFTDMDDGNAAELKAVVCSCAT